MNSNEIRQRFLDFFREKGHKIVPSSSLVPTDDSVLLTTAGMQQFKPYYLDEKSPHGNKVASIQKCFRTSDIDEVGNEKHLTFFEMLGNFSFKDEYFKKEAIEYAYEFITKEMGLEIDYVSVFEGDDLTPPDTESEEIWEKIKKENNENFEIKKFGREDNFWGPTGEEGPCGPTTEIYVNPAGDGAGALEIWNLVFNEYYKNKEGKYNKLDKPGVDTGMGLERLAMVVQKKNNIFETDLFEPIMKVVGNNRVVTDHLRASVFLIADGVVPSNVGRGYVLRRLIRRVVAKGFGNAIEKTVGIIVENYKDFYFELEQNKNKIFTELKKEEEIFNKTLEKGMREFKRGTDPFVLFTTYGFPIELTQELSKEKGAVVDIEKFNQQMQKHQELSRTASAGMFKGGLADESEETTKLHTAAHLLLAALRKILGDHVEQKGSNITIERLRFDFSHPEKLTDEQKKEIERLVNKQIKKDLSVTCEEMKPEEAKEKGALGVFEHKYGDIVTVYAIGAFSREICGGPHVKKTGKLGTFKIKKEEASSAGVRRIKAVLI
ncbi:alanine--tRNA ligase [Patescibacteria group bacterium]|nr:alanine--tRNA ligase [Patescibacteria group bacterium]